MVPVVHVFAEHDDLCASDGLRFIEPRQKRVRGWATRAPFGCKQLDQNGLPAIRDPVAECRRNGQQYEYQACEGVRHNYRSLQLRFYSRSDSLVASFWSATLLGVATSGKHREDRHVGRRNSTSVIRNRSPGPDRPSHGGRRHAIRLSPAVKRRHLKDRRCPESRYFRRSLRLQRQVRADAAPIFRQQANQVANPAGKTNR